MNDVFDSISSASGYWVLGWCIFCIVGVAVGMTIFALQLRRMSRSVLELAKALDEQSRRIHSLGRMLQEDLASLNANLVRHQSAPGLSTLHASQTELLRAELQTLRDEIATGPDKTAG